MKAGTDRAAPAAPRRRGARAAWILGGLLFVLAAAAAGLLLRLRSSLPQQSGERRLAGLEAPVTIHRDARGIPQIWAERERDAWFALGWVQAGDRLFQMDLFRRMAAGRLSEILGPRALEVDRRQRTLGFEALAQRAAGRLDPETRRAIEAYRDGVNAWVRRGGAPPFEYTALRALVRPWTTEDVVACFIEQSYDLQPLVPDDFHDLLRRTAAERARSLLLAPEDRTPAIVEGDSPRAATLAAAGDRASGSNSWVLAPARTRSGAPILSNDPHLQVDRLPTPLYLAGMHAKDTGLDLVGASIPALPYFPLGHNGRSAWGATASMAFSGALIAVPEAPGDSTSYLWGGEARTFESKPETLHVPGERAPRVFPSRRTHLGPVVGKEDGRWIVLRWAAFELPIEEALAGGFALVRCADLRSFRAAVARIGTAGISWTYAGRDGTIGYQLGGALPRYENGAPYEIVAAPDSGWTSLRPFDESPHLSDPPSGWIAAANNPPAAWVPGEYAFVRALRLAEILPGIRDAGAAAMRELQLDRISPVAVRFRTLAAQAARDAGAEPAAVSLEAWDGRVDADSREAALFLTWWRRLPIEIFGDDLAGGGLPYVTATAVLERTVASAGEPWWDDAGTAAVETRGEILALAMRAALAEAAGARWGEIHPYSPSHPFAASRWLDRALRLRRGPLPAGGDGTTVGVARGEGLRPPFPVVHGPAARFVVDLADPDGASLALAGGQSGNPLSPHFADFVPGWAEGEDWNVPFTREAVEERAVKTLRLLPR